MIARSLLRTMPVLSLFLAACGGGLAPRIEGAMDGCLAFRREAFKKGEQVAQLRVSLPRTVDSLATLVAYDAASRQFEQIAEAAPDQVTLVCALEIMARNSGDRTTLFLKRYLRHPNQEVSEWATVLLTGRRGGIPRQATGQ